MADAGAVRIKGLIETPSASLGAAVSALRSSLESIDPETETPPPAALAALESMRRFYAGLAAQIEAIDTAGTGPRDEALAALGRLERGIDSFGSGLAQGVGGDDPADLAKAKRRLDRAGADLARAGERIA